MAAGRPAAEQRPADGSQALREFGTTGNTCRHEIRRGDIESEAEVQSVPVVIDRSFDDDF